jgi:hypothetical protein
MRMAVYIILYSSISLLDLYLCLEPKSKALIYLVSTLGNRCSSSESLNHSISISYVFFTLVPRYNDLWWSEMQSSSSWGTAIRRVRTSVAYQVSISELVIGRIFDDSDQSRRTNIPLSCHLHNLNEKRRKCSILFSDAVSRPQE